MKEGRVWDIDVQEGDDYNSVEMMVSDRGITLFLTMNMVQAQEVANDLQKIIDEKCEGKSPELSDTEVAVHRAHIDQWNACQTIIHAAETLKKQADLLLER